MTFHELGEEIKAHEAEWKTVVPANNYLMLRLDGKAFSSYTKETRKPYDHRVMEAMDAATLALCQQLQNVVIAYTQSDEITVVMDTTHSHDAEHWMGGKVQKILSISAAIASTQFNMHMQKHAHRFVNTDFDDEFVQKVFNNEKVAVFDSRILTFDNSTKGQQGVSNALKWRFIDCEKNSINMAAHHVFGDKKLFKVNTQTKRQMLIDAANNNPHVKTWEELHDGFKFGRYVSRENRIEEVSYVDKRDSRTKTITVERTPFVVKNAIPEDFFTLIGNMFS